LEASRCRTLALAASSLLRFGGSAIVCNEQGDWNSQPQTPHSWPSAAVVGISDACLPLPLEIDDLYSGELGKHVKVSVTGKQDMRMLQDESCDPHVVRRDGSALLTQLPVNGSVMVRRLLVGIQHTDPRLEEKAPEDGFITRSLGTDGKSGAQFAEDDKGQPDFLGKLDRLNDRFDTPAKVRVTIGVEG
ncbi:MAG TPA: hypothetical protein VLQ90_09060, partial [Pyrinomonadaceae bacterium]|nr:hypothetical protein [Pyrinomonadaceae bacterium]